MSLDLSLLDKLCSKIIAHKAPVLENLSSGAKAYLIASLAKKLETSIFYISAEASPLLLEDLKFFSKEPLELPVISDIDPNPDLKGLELKTLLSLKKDPLQVVSGSLINLVKRYVAKDTLQDEALTLQVNKTCNFSFLEQKLLSFGFKQTACVTEKGQFAKRGGIYDFFAFDANFPIRCEFDDDTIISLREFDPILQTSIKKIEKTSLLGCLKQEEEASIFSYLTKKPLVIFDGMEHIEEQWSYMQKLKETSLKLPPCHLLFFAETYLSSLFSHKDDAKNFLNLNLPLEAISSPFLDVNSFFITSSKPNFEELKFELPHFLKQNGKAFITYSSPQEKSLLQKEPLGIELVPGFLSKGFFLPEHNILFLSYQDFSDKRHIRRSNFRLSSSAEPNTFEVFHPGDIIVHAHQGIGKFLGCETKVNHLGQEAEYFKLEFSEKSILYVPIKEAHILTRYVGSSQEVPTFSQLGSTRWQKIRAQTQASIMGYAKQLLELAAKRQLDKGYSYPKDSSLQQDFENDFPFVATDDQIKAIDAIKHDMENGVPMDRLICGDVGYGKTEVAMRAAFKAVCDGKKQVAVLVPTTVLAMQHFENFKERMMNFPVRIGVLSRFLSQKEIKATLKGVLEGTIDILIGTHRLLSPDVVFKDLGLMIVDEEQRFGVKAKEKLKTLKTNVDCLTLSATPIPRTLYTSIVGLKQMSVISTPPYDRLPIRTILTVKEDELIKQALLRELSRKGQAYFIHNRVENLPLIHKKLKELIPEAKIAIAHGQMDPDEIDVVFHGFKEGTIDILIATTLVESGIDIPNANTILIDQAHHFGLSDLYQLRGRVGRWNKAASCFLLIPKNTLLDESSRKRLDVIVSTSGYGGGLKVAMRDLEIRGAGDLLGIDQSGQVSQIGFHLYCKLLKKTLSSMQKNVPIAPVETKIDAPLEAKIQESYIDSLDIRIEFYHRFGEAETLEETDVIFKELEDRFGKAPLETCWLYVLCRIKIYCQKHCILSLTLTKKTAIFEKRMKGQIEKKMVAINLDANPFSYEKQLINQIEKQIK